MAWVIAERITPATTAMSKSRSSPYENGDLFRRSISYISDGLGADAAGALDGNAAALLGL
jgi:hypothetical protein